MMYSGAYIEICGKLGSDVELKHSVNGQKYGVLFITINKVGNRGVLYNKKIFETNCYKVVIWNENILKNQIPLLKKGDKVLLIGNLYAFNADGEIPASQYLISVGKNGGGIKRIEDVSLEGIHEEDHQEVDQVMEEVLFSEFS